jgi:hypothetical protein
LKNTLSAVPPDTPVVFFCLDNSSFMGLKEDGSMAIISKCVEGDDGFHVVGELVVAPEPCSCPAQTCGGCLWGSPSLHRHAMAKIRQNAMLQRRRSCD